MACHAVYGAHNETGFELCDGSFLTIRRIAAAGADRVSTRLVFLSACEAGVSGRTQAADEFVGLPGTLLELGVMGVIAPLWAVYDDAALVFADHFYRVFLDASGCPRCNPADALRQTREFIRNVTWGELRREGYLDDIGEDALASVRLRKIGAEPANPGWDRQPDEGERPFSSPEHWAGWVLFGR